MSFPHDGTYTVCGMERSGSTLVFQILSHLGLDVKKTHSYNLDNTASVKFYTVRDPRDVICSYARTVLKKELEDGILEYSTDFCRREDLRAACFRLFYRPNARQLDYRLYMWEANYGAPVVFINYEEYILGNERKLIKDIMTLVSQFEAIDTSDQMVDEITETYSMDANHKRSLKYSGFEEWCTDTGIHGNHISALGKSTWRDEFDYTIAVCVDRYLGDFLIELGYEKSRDWIKEFKDK